MDYLLIVYAKGFSLTNCIFFI